MARNYEKLDYVNLEPSNMTESELRKNIDKAASAVNARIRAAQKITGYEGSTFWANYQLKQEQDPKFFNSKTNRAKRSVKSFSRQELEDYLNALADLMIDTPVKQEFESWDKKDDFHKALSNIRKYDPETFRKIIKKIKDKPIEDDQEYIDGSPDDEEVEDIKEVYEQDFTQEDYEDALKSIAEEEAANYKQKTIEQIKTEGQTAYLDQGKIRFKKE